MTKLLNYIIRLYFYTKGVRRLELINALESKRAHVSERKVADKLQSGVNRTTIRHWRKRYEIFGLVNFDKPVQTSLLTYIGLKPIKELMRIPT